MLALQRPALLVAIVTPVGVVERVTVEPLVEDHELLCAFMPEQRFANRASPSMYASFKASRNCR